jgi:DNA repair protein RadC
MKIIVNEVKEAPAIGKVQMQQGIRTKEEAMRWAEREGFAVVYLFKKHERVYADRTTKQSAAGVQLLAEAA